MEKRQAWWLSGIFPSLKVAEFRQYQTQAALESLFENVGKLFVLRHFSLSRLVCYQHLYSTNLPFVLSYNAFRAWVSFPSNSGILFDWAGGGLVSFAWLLKIGLFNILFRNIL